MTLTAVTPSRRFAHCASRTIVAGLVTLLLLGGCGDNPDTLVASARKEIEKKEYRTAILQLKTALQKDANHKDARFALGVALQKSGDLAGSEKELRKAMDLGYDKAQVTPALARVVYDQGRLDDFIKEFSDLQLASPADYADLKALTGNAMFSKGKVVEAAKAFEESLRLNSANTTARVGQARIAAARSDFVGAAAIVGEVLGKSPKDREALTLQSALHLVKGEKDQAVAVHRKLVEYYPDGVTEHYALATLLLETGKLEEAKAAAVAMAKVAPIDPRTLHVESMLAYQAKDYVLAQQRAVKALSRAPSFGPAQLMAGAASVHLKNYQQGIQYLTEVVKVQKRNLFAHQLLVAAYVGAGETQRASRALKDSLEIFPNDPKLLLLAGELAAKDRNLGGASKYFELSAEKGEASGVAALRHGQALLAEGKEDEALRVLEESANAGGKNVQSDVMLVMHHLRRGEFDKALKWIDSVEKKSPASPVGPTLRGAVYLGKRDLANARKQFELALQRDGSTTAPMVYLARLDIAEKKLPDAKRRYLDAIAKYPKSEQLVVDYSRLLRASGEKLDVVTAPLRSFIQGAPGAERVRLMLIESTLASGDRKKAVTAAQEALAAIPGSIAVKMALGRTLQAAGEHNQALSTFSEVLTQQPKFLPALIAAAQAQEATGDHARALESLSRAQDIAPDNIEIRRAKVQVHLRAKQPERALEVARAVRQKSPKLPIGYELEAAVLVAMDKWGDAADVLQAGQTALPSTQMMVKLHAALVQAGRKDRAAQVMSTWLAANGKDVQTRVYMAERASQDGDHTTAVRYYREALVLAPSNPILLNNLAWASDQIQDPKALTYAEEAYKLAPDSPAVMDTLGWMLVQKGDAARGVDLLAKATAAAPQALAIRFNYARALLKTGRKDDARKELDLLKSQGDNFKDQAALEALYKQL